MSSLDRFLDVYNQYNIWMVNPDNQKILHMYLSRTKIFAIWSACWKIAVDKYRGNKIMRKQFYNSLQRVLNNRTTCIQQYHAILQNLQHRHHYHFLKCYRTQHQNSKAQDNNTTVNKLYIEATDCYMYWYYSSKQSVFNSLLTISSSALALAFSLQAETQRKKHWYQWCL